MKIMSHMFVKISSAYASAISLFLLCHRFSFVQMDYSSKISHGSKPTLDFYILDLITSYQQTHSEDILSCLYIALSLGD